MKKYDDYKDPKNDSIRMRDELTDDEINNIKWTKFKIVVPTKEDKIALEEAFHYIHNSDMDTDYVTVNQLAHTYLNEEEGYEYNIIVDEKIYNELPEYRKKK